MAATKKILVLGASGLIGRFVTDDLRARGFHVVGVARRFSSSQATGTDDLEMPLVAMDSGALARLIDTHDIDVVVNCVGLLQDVPGRRCWRRAPGFRRAAGAGDPAKAAARSTLCTSRSRAKWPATAPTLPSQSATPSV
jgi:uncharacterized protein YbjT (DUF2867 family)